MTRAPKAVIIFTLGKFLIGDWTRCRIQSRSCWKSPAKLCNRSCHFRCCCGAGADAAARQWARALAGLAACFMRKIECATLIYPGPMAMGIRYVPRSCSKQQNDTAGQESNCRKPWLSHGKTLGNSRATKAPYGGSVSENRVDTSANELDENQRLTGKPPGAGMVAGGLATHPVSGLARKTGFNTASGLWTPRRDRPDPARRLQFGGGPGPPGPPPRHIGRRCVRATRRKRLTQGFRITRADETSRQVPRKIAPRQSILLLRPRCRDISAPPFCRTIRRFELRLCPDKGGHLQVAQTTPHPAVFRAKKN